MARTSTGVVTSRGTYTPTVTNVTNIASSTPYAAAWSRVGDFVTVAGKVDIDVTAGTAYTVAYLSLPIASNINQEDLAGCALSNNSGNASGLAVGGEAGSDQAFLAGIVGATATVISYFYTFSYRIK